MKLSGTKQEEEEQKAEAGKGPNMKPGGEMPKGRLSKGIQVNTEDREFERIETKENKVKKDMLV